MPHAFWDREEIAKTILEKVVFFILSDFFLIWGSMSKNLKNGPYMR
jgi:hypothetical protein